MQDCKDKIFDKTTVVFIWELTLPCLCSKLPFFKTTWQMLDTLHLKIKKLSTNSSGDFDSVLDTINHYWIDPAK